MATWQFICILCWIVYTVLYFGRINFSITLPWLQSECGYTKASLGFMASGFFITYAAGQFINGILGDRFNPRHFIAIGLLGSALNNIAFGITNNFTARIIFWALNGYFQSMLWGPLVMTISKAAPQEHLHQAMMFISASPIAGYFLSYILVGRMAISIRWEAAFFLPGILLLGAALLWFALFPAMGRAGQKQQSAEKGQGEIPRQGLGDFIFRSRLWIIALLCMLVGVVKEGLLLWGPTFFSELLSFDMAQVLLVMSLFPLINMLSLLLCGTVYRKFNYDERRTMIVFLGLSILFAVLLRMALTLFYLYLILAFCGLLAAIYAVNNILVAFVPVFFRSEQRVSTAAGIIDSAFYAGAAISGPVSGLLADKLGWAGIILGWLACCCAAALVTITAINFKKGIKH